MSAQPRPSHDPREDIFIEIIRELWGYDTEGIKSIAARAGCHWVTLFAWKSGRTNYPQLNKIAAVARALGFNLVLQRNTVTNHKLRRIK